LRHLIVGTAGHIDHGKSALVKRLTGKDPDRLKEEQARGITIDLGFADLDLGEDRVVSFVDVPGHERFVRHMVSGAAGIDAVLLVVAADEGVKPQTREHVDVCRLLGVRHGLTVLSKTDLVDSELLSVVALEVAELLEGGPLGEGPVIPVSVRDGRGLERLEEALGRLFDEVPARSAAGVARLPVDRSFVMKGFGTVVTGSLASGRLREGDEVTVLPQRLRGRIRGLQVHGRPVAEVGAGRRAAVNVQGLDCEQVPRGATLAAHGSLPTTRYFWARLELLPGAPERLRRGGVVRFHQGTSERRARFRVVEERADGSLAALFFLDRPAVLLPGDRFIVRRPSPVNTLGGGRVLDALPPRGRPAPSELAALESAGPREMLLVRLGRSGESGEEVSSLAEALGLGVEELEPLARPLVERGALRRIGARWFAAGPWASVERRLEGALGELHRSDPLRAGVAREELRSRVCPRMTQDAWRTLLEGLRSAGRVELVDDRVALAGHRVVLSARDRELAERIERAFLEAGLDPPDAGKAIAGEDRNRAERLLEHLIAGGALVRIHGGRLFHAKPLADLSEKLREYARGSKTIDVATFKELAGVTRKNAIPLLEHLDASRLTRRTGNVRELVGFATDGDRPKRTRS